MPTTTYLLLMSCWDVDPAARPSFPQLQQTLSQNEGSKDSWQLRELDGRASSDKVYGDGWLSAISLLEMMPNSKVNMMDRLEREILSNISAPPRRASTPFDTEKSSFFTGAYPYTHATKKPTQKNNKVGPDLPPLLPQAPRVQASASADRAGVSGSSRLVKVLPTPRPALAIAGMQPPPTTMLLSTGKRAPIAIAPKLLLLVVVMMTPYMSCPMVKHQSQFHSFYILTPNHGM